MNGSPRAVFLSYASQDAEAALRICASLRDAGIEVWFDQNELRGGDAWDAKIRQQIKACALFVPIISLNSHGRAEGYFRLEWKLAVDRSHLMASDRAFIVPVLIDGVRDADARVPEKFREVQWTRLPRGETTPAFVARLARLLVDAEPERPISEATSEPRAVGAEAIRERRPIARGEPLSPVRPTSFKPHWKRRLTVAWCAAALLTMAAAAAAWVARSHLRGAPAIVPYSIDDRRMTFAVIPFQGPSNDPHGMQVAQATAEAVTASLERLPQILQIVPPRSVADAVRRLARPRDLARALEVHFLVGGTVTRSDAGYSVGLTVTDGSTEHVLQTADLSVTGEALQPRWRDDIEYAMYRLWYAAMKDEAERAADKPFSQLDVRDLTFRAYTYWIAHPGAAAKNGYTTATDLLHRALTLAPDDPLALELTAVVNLCDCTMAWSHDVEKQKAIGAAAMDKVLQSDPNNPVMLAEKADILRLRGRPEESLAVAEAILQQDPDSEEGLAAKAAALLRLGRAREALPLVAALRAHPTDNLTGSASLAAAVHFALSDYAAAAQFADAAVAQMSQDELRSPVTGPVRLILAATAAELGQRERAQAALGDFYAAVPQARTIRAIRAWIYPTAYLYAYEPLFDGLRKAGVPD